MTDVGGHGSGPLPDVSPEEALALQAGGVVLLDVREPEEWEAGHAPDSRHVPLGRLRADTLAAGTEVVVVCRSGGRSAVAAAALAGAGVAARNLSGGLNAWAAAGLPVVRDDGRPGTVA